MVRFSARIHPRTSRNALRMNEAGVVEIWTTASPVDGKANDAVRRIVATWCDVSLWNVSIVSGMTSRTKIIEVDGVSLLPRDTEVSA